MKKLLSLIIVFVLLSTLNGCVKDKTDDNGETGGGESIINIYTLNDFHGAIFEDGNEVGISKLGKFLITEKNNNPDTTFIISAGDMFQGTAVSSMTRGDIVVDIMNEIGFDAMTIGNHEFDWGIDGITRFIDNDLTNNETNFPLIGANIHQKSTNELAEWTTPYAIIDRGNLKIGVIGTLGEDQINDILASIVEDYEFTDQLTAIKKYTKILRTEEECDIVIVSSHADTSPINNMIANLSGEYKVDAVINGHTHRYYAAETYGEGDVPLPIVQSGNNGMFLGKITLEVDLDTKEVTDAYSEFIPARSTFLTPNYEIDQIINQYSTEIAASNEVLGIAGEDIYRTSATIWAANSVRKYSNTDIGVINSGGIRAAAFPINANSTVTFGNIFKLMPFENTIVTMKLTGLQIKSIISSSDSLYFSSNVSSINQTINDEDIDNEKLYTVSTIDYVFEQSRYPFKDGQDIVFTDFLFRDQLVNDVKNSVETNGKWYLN